MMMFTKNIEIFIRMILIMVMFANTEPEILIMVMFTNDEHLVLRTKNGSLIFTQFMKHRAQSTRTSERYHI